MKPISIERGSHPLYVAIATAGRPESVVALLGQLINCARPLSFRGVVVVENGAKSGLQELISAFDSHGLDITYVYSALPNKSHALNLALDNILEQDAIIFFTDDDACIRDDILNQYYSAALEKGPRHYFGGPVERSIGSPEVSTWMLPLQPLSITGWAPIAGSVKMAFLGINWAAFKSDLEYVGKFDVRFGPGSRYGCTGQEANMQIRLIDAGCEAVLVKKAIVDHRAPDDSRYFSWLIRRHYRGGIYNGLHVCAARFDSLYSIDHEMQLNVLDRSAVPTGFDYLLYRIARPVVHLAHRIGFFKGRFLRLMRR